MANVQAIRQLDDDELAIKLVDAHKELFNLRFQLATGRLDNISRIGQVRREIARIRTISTERELQIDRSAVSAKALEKIEANRVAGRSRRTKDKSPEDVVAGEEEV